MLYLYRKLYIFGKIDSPLCSNCFSNDETIVHLFWECVRVSQLWNQLRIFFSTDLNLPLLTPQTAIFGFLAENDKCIFKITNHLLMIFKRYIYIYRSREMGKVRKIKILEKNIATNNTNKLVIDNKKWEKTYRAIKILT